MNKSNRPISRNAIKMELTFAMDLIKELNFGMAHDIISRILSRIEKYDLTPPEKKGDEKNELSKRNQR